MKKIISAIITLAMLLSMASGILVNAAEEFILYDSFEAGTSNWIYYDKATKSNTKTVLGKASDGKMSLYLNDESTSNTVGLQSQIIKIDGGKSYTVSVDIYHQKGYAVTMQYNFVDGTGKKLSGVSISTQTMEKWEPLSVAQLAPTAAYGIVLIIAGTAAGTGTSYFDNVKVKESKVDSSGVAIDAPSEIDTTGNLAFSETFEDDSNTFKASDTKAPNCWVITEDQASGGKNSLYFTDYLDTLMVGIGSPWIPISEMRKYRMSADIFAIEGRTQMQVRVYDTDRVEIYRKTGYSETGTKRWATFNIDVNGYPGAGYVKIFFCGEKAPMPSSYIDNVKLTDIGSLGTVDVKSKALNEDLNYRLSLAKPGDVIEVEDGVYQHIDLTIPTSGTAEQPITLKAKNPGKVIFKGLSGLEVSGSHIIIEGLTWENAVKVPDIMTFTSASSYCHLKDCAIIDSYAEDYASDQRWVGMGGNYHKVTGCYFRGKHSKGLMLELGISTKLEEPGRYLVENCYFGDFKFGTVNGLEVIRTGLSSSWEVYGNSIIRNNFFEKCDGEVEIISTKCSGNKIYNNTFYNSKGAVYSRHGNDNEYTGNLFVGGDDAVGRGTGIQVYGDNHVVKNNYFYNLAMESEAIFLPYGNGHANWVGFLQPLRNVDISNNTFVNCDANIVVDEPVPLEKSSEKQHHDVPPEATIKDNAFISYKGVFPVVQKNSTAPDGVKFVNNVASRKEISNDEGVAEGVTQVDFDYEIKDGYLIPANGLGADIEEIKKAPKNPFDVIPDWIKKEFYDSGKYTFEIVEGDPFNTDFDVADLFPAKDGGIDVIVNGYNIEFDVEPQLINSRTMVPMRAIFEEFDADVSWDEATATATAVTEFKTITITENSDIAYVNSTPFKLDSPAVIINGRFLVPLRFISESFGADVQWYDDITTVKIAYIPPIGNIYNREFKPQVPIENALTVYSAIQSGGDGTTRTIKDVFNGGFTDKWPFKELADGTPGYGIFDLGSVKTIDKMMISFGSGDARVYKFSIYVSDDGVNYTLAKENLSNSGVSLGLETFEMGGVKGRYVKYVGYGSNVNTWNNISELFIIGK